MKKLDPEYGVDSRYTSDEEKEKESKSLMDARLLRIKNLSEKQIEEAKKLQIKLKNENFKF